MDTTFMQTDYDFLSRSIMTSGCRVQWTEIKERSSLTREVERGTLRRSEWN
jgi:hypothetical protein